MHSTLELFTPITGTFGGGLIGLSAAVLLLFGGEILGSSGIVSSIMLEPKKHITDPKQIWKLIFMSTFMLFSNLALAKHFTGDDRLGEDPSIPIVSRWGYLLGGLFVGFGTRLGNGCTTGHGICGMPRLSLRSITAVCSFMLSALGTFAVISPDNKTFASGTEWLRTDTPPSFYNQWLGFGVSFIFVVPTLVALYYLATSEKKRRSSLSLMKKEFARYDSTEDVEKADAKKEDGQESTEKSAAEENTTENASEQATEPTNVEDLKEKVQEAERGSADGKIIPAIIAACLFSLGLAISQMVIPSKVLGFLALYTIPMNRYDPTLLTVMCAGALVSFISYQFVEGWGVIKLPSKWMIRAPLTSSKFCIPTNNTIDWKLVLGSFCFGIGWAMAGLCPGPAKFLAASGTEEVLAFWWPFYFVGAFLAQKLKDRFA